MSAEETAMDLLTATPREIDTVLAGLYSEQQTIGGRIRHARDRIMYTAGARRTYGRRGNPGWNLGYEEATDKVRAMADDPDAMTWDRRSAAEAIADYDAACADMRKVHEEQRRIGAEFQRRGGWTRAYLVTDGHVHSSMDCSTCNNGQEPTRFTWLVEFSGGTEEAVVAAAAERACTVCYPSAPVETAGPSALMTPDERTRAQQREDAAKAKADRLAKKIAKGLTPDGSEFQVSYVEDGREHVLRSDGTYVSMVAPRERRESFKTEQAAVQWMVQYMAWGRSEQKAPAFEAIIEAVAAKHGKPVEEVRAEVEEKVAAKIKRDNR